MKSDLVSRWTALLVLAVLVITSVVSAPAAQAQSAVTGTADFRNAPQLIPGQYRDRLVTGDSAWYSVVYTNETPYRFDVAVDGVRPSDVQLTASFVAPTLDTVDGPDATVDGGGVTYPLGHTNVWFLKVTMETSGQAGVEYPIIISVDGVQSVGREECSPSSGCTLKSEYEEILDRVADAEAQTEALNPQNAEAEVERELVSLRESADTAAQITRPAAENRLARAQATMAELCAPNETCEEFPEPPSKTPTIGLIVGFLALAAGARMAFKKLRSARPKSDDDDDSPDGAAVSDPVAAPPERPPIAL